jgi:hypothetical protein
MMVAKIINCDKHCGCKLIKTNYIILIDWNFSCACRRLTRIISIGHHIIFFILSHQKLGLQSLRMVELRDCTHMQVSMAVNGSDVSI